MQLTEPKAKKFCRLPKPFPLPIIRNKSNGGIYKFPATFNGFTVVIEGAEDMKKIISMGYFGKANLSRSYPNFQQSKTEILRARQFERRNKFKSDGTLAKKVLVLPDSDSDEDNNYFTNLKPKYEMDKSGISETVCLGLEEAFFLFNAIGCLNLEYQGVLLESGKIWSLFSETEPHFQLNYVAYYYYRSKNWVVKPGIKFGGDFLLYKQGPPFYHASYVVIVEILDCNLQRIDKFSRRSMDTVSLMGLNRLCETAGKELLICQIICPETEEIDYNNLSGYTIKETLMKRWISTQERQNEDN